VVSDDFNDMSKSLNEGAVQVPFLGDWDAQAVELFRERKEIGRKLQAMHDVASAYLTLGQPLSTLSGGDCQRIKLASDLHKDGSEYMMDEPTTGLHMSDIAHLLGIIDRVVDGRHTVTEHNLDALRSADWIIDLGLEGGNKGGDWTN